MPVSSQTIAFKARDDETLVGTIFEPADQPHTVLLINSGTGIPRRFYNRIANHAAGQGFAVLTFDYRGIGDSAPASLRGYEANYRDWGQRDVPGAITLLSNRYPDLPLVALGHSTGGQQLGLAENVDRVRAAVFIAVSTGYWRGMPWRYKLFSLVIWNVFLPLMSRLYGYAPAKMINWGENLPTGIAKEWGAWCMEEKYMAAFFDNTGHRTSPNGKPFGPIHFDKVDFPIRSIHFTDDPISSRKNVPPMLDLFDKAIIKKLWISPNDVGATEIGHLGFFRDNIGKPLWDDTLNWLRTQNEPS